jgi:hypothetical protein
MLAAQVLPRHQRADDAIEPEEERLAQRETSGSWTGFFRCLNLWPSDPSGHNIWDKIVSNLVGDRCQKTACGSISAPGDSNDD